MFTVRVYFFRRTAHSLVNVKTLVFAQFYFCSHRKPYACDRIKVNVAYSVTLSLLSTLSQKESHATLYYIYSHRRWIEMSMGEIMDKAPKVMVAVSFTLVFVQRMHLELQHNRMPN